MNEVNEGGLTNSRRFGSRLRRPAVLLASAMVAGAGAAVLPAATATAVPVSLCADATTALFGQRVRLYPVHVPDSYPK